MHMLRIQNGTIFGAPLQFVSDSYMGRNEQGISLALGIYFGLVVLAVMLSVTGAVTLQDQGYVLYSIPPVLMALTQGTINGPRGAAPVGRLALVEQHGAAGDAAVSPSRRCSCSSPRSCRLRNARAV
jgi:hypothetical protein